MSIVFIQLSDMHLVDSASPILGKKQKLCDAIVAEVKADVNHCCIVQSGDSAFSGKPSQFELAKDILLSIRDTVADHVPSVETSLVLVPGNHDCDFSGDQTVRDIVLNDIAAEEDREEVLNTALSPLNNYFTFVDSLGPQTISLTASHPLFTYRDISADGKLIRFYLFNSSWMSSKDETPGTLLFPLNTIVVPEYESDVEYSVAVLHHPWLWFKQPEAMRPLRERIESISDLVFTGHEHVPTAYRKDRYGADSHEYIEGGVLHESGQPDVSSFNVLRLDFRDDSQCHTTYRWSAQGCLYCRSPEHFQGVIGRNRTRVDNRRRLASSWEAYLEDAVLPVARHPREIIKLSDIYIYPDLRAFESSAVPGEWQRVKSKDVFETLAGLDRVLITGDEDSGKSSLAKRLFRDYHRTGDFPILVNGNDIRKQPNASTLRKLIAAVLKSQYAALLPDEYEQLPNDRKVLIIDDFQAARAGRAARQEYLEAFDQHFGKVVLIGNSDFCIEEVHAEADHSKGLWKYSRYDICEFGYLRLEDLTRKWLLISNACDGTPDDLESEVRRVCKVVEQVLSLDVIPHHPWIIIVLLQQTDSAEGPAAKNGSYGHLYQAVITAALARSSFKRLDINGKFTYLAGFAFKLFELEKASLSEVEMRALHTAHCERYDLSLDLEPLRSDLVDTGLLRYDNEQLAFAAKYSYCFFIAWYLFQHMHEERTVDLIRELTTRVYHSESANILVFLSHLSNNPIVLAEMKRTAARLFHDAPPIEFASDTAVLNSLAGVKLPLTLPSTAPRENRERVLDGRDERLARRTRKEFDGREISHPGEEERMDNGCSEMQRFARELRAATKTIQILGQVLRNGAGVIEGLEKRSIVEEIYALSRRLLGNVFEGLPSEIAEWIEAVTNYHMEQDPKLDKDNATKRANRHVFGMSLLAAFYMSKHVSASVGLDQLRMTFERVLECDPSIPNRVYDLAINLEHSRSLPISKAVNLYKESSKNYFVQALVQSLVADHLYMYDVTYRDKQSICDQVGIGASKQTLNPARKLLRGPTNRG